MVINVDCKYYHPVKIGEKASHGTFDAGEDIIDDRCRHPKASRHRNLVSANGLCNTSHDYCPYNPARVHDPSSE